MAKCGSSGLYSDRQIEIGVRELNFDQNAMTGSGGFVEIQGTAEGEPFKRNEMNAMLDLAQEGIDMLISKQKAALGL